MCDNNQNNITISGSTFQKNYGIIAGALSATD